MAKAHKRAFVNDNCKNVKRSTKFSLKLTIYANHNIVLKV